jgi:hypothetical protein
MTYFSKPIFKIEKQQLLKIKRQTNIKSLKINKNTIHRSK